MAVCLRERTGGIVGDFLEAKYVVRGTPHPTVSHSCYSRYPLVISGISGISRRLNMDIMRADVLRRVRSYRL